MRASIVLLAQNETGYQHLMRLASALWLDPARMGEMMRTFHCAGA